MIVVVFEHVWGEDWMPRVLSGHVESEVAMFIDFRNLVGSVKRGVMSNRCKATTNNRTV